MNSDESVSIVFCSDSQKELNKIYNNIDFAFEFLYELHCGKRWYVILFTLNRPYDKEHYPDICHYKIESFVFATAFKTNPINFDYAFDTGKFIVGIDHDSNLKEHEYYKEKLNYRINKPYPMYKALIPLSDNEMHNSTIKDVILKMFAKHPTAIHCFDDLLDRFVDTDQNE